MKYLLVVDLQKEFIKDGASRNIYERCLDYIKHSKDNYMSTIALVFENDTDKNINFERYLGYSDCKNPLPIDFEADRILKHRGYSIEDSFKINKDDEFDVIGFDTDACVLATCFKLFDSGCRFNVLKDYCWSSGGLEIHNVALRIMERQFGSVVK